MVRYQLTLCGEFSVYTSGQIEMSPAPHLPSGGICNISGGGGGEGEGGREGGGDWCQGGTNIHNE